MNAIVEGAKLVFDPFVLFVMLASSVYGIVVGAIPGLTAVMAVSLLIPVTLFLDPIPALGSIIACVAMAIFAGDIPGTLLRIPGTPASGAYTDDSYNLTLQGKAELALGCNVTFSAVGGIIGTILLVAAAPLLAEFALNFSTYEYFWLACMGLTCAVFMTTDDPVKGTISLLFGLGLTTIGYDDVAGQPRFTFGITELLGGIGIIPPLIGLFAVSEVMRRVSSMRPPASAYTGRVSNIFKGIGKVWRKNIVSFLRGNSIGVIVGVLPGAGGDLAAWIAYAVAKRLSKTPEKFGKGHLEGIVSATSANNAALASAWIPALVFGIPGDVTTSMIIGILYVKDLNPGPTLFIQRPEIVYGVFICFFVANIMMLLLGFFAIKAFKQILRIPAFVMLPVILVFCTVGAFAMNNTLFGVLVMLIFGILGYIMEENNFPIAPLLLALVLGNLLERNFMTSMVKSGGDLTAFFSRPIAAGLGAITILIWVAPPILGFIRKRRKAARA